MSVRRIRKIPGYSRAARERFDSTRPKYTDAVKALAAFAPDEPLFALLLARLDAACEEASAVRLTLKRGRTSVTKLSHKT